MNDIYSVDEQQQADAKRLVKLASFASVLVQKRKEAIDGRRESGIEAIWQQDEEYYEGVDGAVKTESKWLKPASVGGTPTGAGQISGRSTVFVNITQPYVDMGSSRVADMLLPTDDKPFAIKPTPIPDIDQLKQSDEPMPDGQMTKGQAATQFEAEAKEKADKAETQIWDWLCEAGWHTEFRKVIEQGAKIGTSVIKGPVPVKRKTRRAQYLPEGIALVIKEELKPDTKFVDAWNLYPDPACGDSIHNGQYIFEKDQISAKQLSDMRGATYIDSEIDLALKEGPAKCNQDGRTITNDTDQYDIWYYHGYATAEDLRATGMEIDEGDMLPVTVTLVNDRVIKASMSIFDSGDFPYDVFIWKRKVGTWTGTGIARQVRTAQRIVNGAARNMMDNAGIASGPQIILKSGDIYPQDGQWTVTPNKIWIADENADANDVRQAFTSIAIPMMQVELENIIKMGLDLAERATSMPLIMQGQQGNNTQTVGGMTILQNNSSSVLRNIAKISDDDVIEPHIKRYYEWLMLYGDDDCKGDAQIQALGSSAFYERDAQNQIIMQLLPMSANAGFQLNPARLMEEVLKMHKISPERVKMTPEELQQLQQQQQPSDPTVQAAQIRAQADLQKAQLTQQSDQKEIEQKDQSTQNEFALKLQLAQMQFEHDKEMKNIDYQIEVMKLSQARNMSIDEIKSQLASTTMKLATQKELSAATLQSEQHKQQAEHHHAKTMQALTPPTEPAGRAEDGMAFQQ